MDGHVRQDLAKTTSVGVGRDEPLASLLAGLWLLNILDFLLTREALGRGVAVEVNAVMGYFLTLGPLASAAFKVGVVTLGVAVLWRLRRHRVTLAATALATALYTGVVLYQLVWLARLAIL